MRHILATILIFTAFAAFAQNNVIRTAGIPYTLGAPTFVPGAGGSLVAIDTISGDWYYSMNRYTDDWIKLGDRVQAIAGCAAPAYTPAKYQSQLVVNSCAVPELYLNTTGSTWVCLNCAASGATNLSWSQLTDSTYQLNSSTGSDVVLKVAGGATASLSGSTLTLSAGGGGAGTVTTDATLSGDGSGGDPLKIAQQSAATSEVLMWTGATWEPSWGNPYIFVTSGSAITTDVNEVLIGTLSAHATFGLPSCSAANDGKRFKFVRNGTDTAYSVTIDPSSTEQFYDGTPTKTFFGKLAIDCTCRYSGGAGVWFFDNF
jgi:hypothetical protein